MKKRLFVTGLSGFVGRNLSTFLENQPNLPWELCEAPAFDLCNAAEVSNAIRAAQPDAVLHLAAQSNVPKAFQDPAHTLQVNLLGTLHLLQALKSNGFTGAFLYVSSGDVYGQVSETDLPIRETIPAVPRNPYGVSKLAAEALCRQWNFSENWRVMIARPFNHIGAGQSDAFILPAVARQLVEMKHGLRPSTLELGDIDVTRDFLDVIDVIRAYFCLLENGQNGETYNVCSGTERTVRELVERLCELASIHPEITQDQTRMRKAEQRRVSGSFDKLRAATGWTPTTPITQTLQTILSDWESRIKK